MEKRILDIAKLLCIVAACPSAGYCLQAQRLDCGACPANPCRELTGQMEERGGKQGD